MTQQEWSSLSSFCVYTQVRNLKHEAENSMEHLDDSYFMQYLRNISVHMTEVFPFSWDVWVIFNLILQFLLISIFCFIIFFFRLLRNSTFHILILITFRFMLKLNIFLTHCNYFFMILMVNFCLLLLFKQWV